MRLCLRPFSPPRSVLTSSSSPRAGCYPFSDRDPFILHQTPHVYYIGNQPSFATRLLSGTVDSQGNPITVRIVLLPKFCETGEVVLVNTNTLEVRVQRFEAEG